MRDVLRMDLILNRNNLLINAAIFVVTWALLSSMGMDSPWSMAFFAGIMAAFFPVTLLTREDKFNAMALACSLPVNRRTVVQGRFLLGLVLAVTGVLLIFGVVAFMPTAEVSGSALFRLDPLTLALGVALLVMSLMMPVTLRLGFTGLIVLLVALQVLGVVFLILAQITGGGADREIIAFLVETVTGLFVTLGTPGFHLVLALALGALLWLSYRASVFLFQRREL